MGSAEKRQVWILKEGTKKEKKEDFRGRGTF